jgi:hypothetical protein
MSQKFNIETDRAVFWPRTDAVKANVEVIHIDHAHVTNRIGRRWFRGAQRERREQQTQRREHQHVCAGHRAGFQKPALPCDWGHRGSQGRSTKK